MNPIRPNNEGRFLKIVNEDIRCFLGDVALGNSTQYRIGVMRSKFGVFIGIQGVGAYEFCGYAHFDYVRDKLGLPFEGDARNVADFINDQLGVDALRQGHYDKDLCRELDL